MQSPSGSLRSVQSPPSAGSPRSPRSPRFSAEGLAVLLGGTRAERAAAYASLEGYCARRLRDAGRAREGSASLAAACIAPLAAVLARPVSEVDFSEFCRCGHTVGALVALDAVTVGAEWLRDGRCWLALAGDGNATDLAVRQVPLQALTAEHVLTMAAVEGCFAPLLAHGIG
eukprot:COSAG06_NODE_27450_length_593_cov_0.736842_1_plen_171_part_10